MVAFWKKTACTVLTAGFVAYATASADLIIVPHPAPTPALSSSSTQTISQATDVLATMGSNLAVVPGTFPVSLSVLPVAVLPSQSGGAGDSLADAGQTHEPLGFLNNSLTVASHEGSAAGANDLRAFPSEPQAGAGGGGPGGGAALAQLNPFGPNSGGTLGGSGDTGIGSTGGTGTGTSGSSSTGSSGDTGGGLTSGSPGNPGGGTTTGSGGGQSGGGDSGSGSGNEGGPGNGGPRNPGNPGTPGQPLAAPEPSTMLLGLFGAGFLVGQYWWRRGRLSK